MMVTLMITMKVVVMEHGKWMDGDEDVGLYICGW